MVQVRRHAVHRFRQRIARLPEQDVVRVLAACADAAPVVTMAGPREVSGQWQGVTFTMVIAGTTVLTVWR